MAAAPQRTRPSRSTTWMPRKRTDVRARTAADGAGERGAGQHGTAAQREQDGQHQADERQPADAGQPDQVALVPIARVRALTEDERPIAAQLSRALHLAGALLPALRVRKIRRPALHDPPPLLLTVLPSHPGPLYRGSGSPAKGIRARRWNSSDDSGILSAPRPPRLSGRTPWGGAFRGSFGVTVAISNRDRERRDGHGDHRSRFFFREGWCGRVYRKVSRRRFPRRRPITENS